jgi:hypothetical protein
MQVLTVDRGAKKEVGECLRVERFPVERKKHFDCELDFGRALVETGEVFGNE